MTRDERARELSRTNKVKLARRYRQISGHIGGMFPPEKWSVDELVNDILAIEYPKAPAGAVSAIAAPAPAAHNPSVTA